MKKVILLFLSLSVSISVLVAQKSITDYVNPLIGTGPVDSGLSGNNYPGATVPFGMVQLSPDTRTEVDWDYNSGYNYNDKTMVGFSHTHLSGTGLADFFDILFMPVTGDVNVSSSNPERFQSAFSHNREFAKPGYYQVQLLDHDIHAELTATTHAGFHRYTFPEGKTGRLTINLNHSRKKHSWDTQVVNSQIKLVDDYTIEGYRVITGWARLRKVYFYARFSKPVINYMMVDGGTVYHRVKILNSTSLNAAFDFDTTDGKPLLVKIALSPVKIENAAENLDKEIPGWDFEQVVANACQLWENELGKIKIEATEQQKEIFYTGLYHTFIQPNTLSDINGNYMGTDFTERNTQNSGHGLHYSTFSLWDTYRGAHPLYTILQPERSADFVKSLIRQYDTFGFLPVWQLWGQDNYCMIGNHSIPVIVDAVLKGIQGIDVNKAYEAIKNSSLVNHQNSPFDVWEKYGYMPENIQTQSVSITLEMAFDDWCVAQLAKKLEKDDDYKRFIARSQYYRNLYNAQTKFFQSKDDKGNWIEPFDPFKYGANGGQPFTEGNAWQYYWYVPHNIPDLIWLTGGKEAFIDKLDDFFTLEHAGGEINGNASGFIGQYAHGNEPSHHVAYLYNDAGQPWKTQYYVSKIMKEMYNTLSSGYAGNEDCGEMSAWYVFSALGFYPVNPVGGVYAFGSPLINRAEIQLPEGKTFVISAKKKSPDEIYIQSVKLNGKSYDKTYIRHSDIMNGGIIEFKMGKNPCIVASISSQQKELFWDENISEHDRIMDLLSRLTIEEKISLLVATSPGIPRLGINHYYYGNEALHGVIRPGRFTVFPQAIGLAGMWNPELHYKIATAISDEARARWNELNWGKDQKEQYSDLLTFWSPTINMARDPRWGRTPETYGEDPYLSGILGTQFVKGLQGDDSRYLKVASTPKHFAANNEEHNRFECNVQVSERQLREYYLPAFEMTVKEGKPASIMSAYNAINNVPCTANPWLLTKVLRQDWGFNGYVVSDCGGPGLLVWAMKYVKTKETAATLSIKAGLDLECGDDVFIEPLLNAYNQYMVTKADIDTAAYRVLRVRMRLGLFDNYENNPYNKISPSVVGSEKHQQLALEAARQSIVLLKNKNNTLPLNLKKIKSIAVVGINAGTCEFGDYSGVPANTPVSVLQGIRNHVGEQVKIVYAPWKSASDGMEIISKDNFPEGLTTEYFSNMSLDGVPKVRKEEWINYEPANQAPDPFLPATPLSIRWTGKLKPAVSGYYTFSYTSSDGCRLFIDGKQLIDDWRGRPITTDTVGMFLEAGKTYNLKAEYFKNRDYAIARLQWKVPAITVKEKIDMYGEAGSAVRSCEKVIAVLGINKSIEREGQDRHSIELPSDQMEFIKEIYKINPNTIVVLIAGSSLSINWLDENIPAIVNAWYPGEQGGNAVAEVLFGDYNPAGRLPVTYYDSLDELPAFDDYDTSKGRTYRYFRGKPLYPFGYGLSYTTFEYKNLKIKENGNIIEVLFDVKNTGSMSGDEVSQVYVSLPETGVVLPLKELKGFQRNTIKKGETKQVNIEIRKDLLRYWDENLGTFVVPDGNYKFMVGSSSTDIKLSGIISCYSSVKQKDKEPADYVNPFIGASTNTAHSYHGLGKTFPGATTPFGMTQVSPNTITGGDNGSGYSYEHKTIEGFAFTQMSGVGWYGDLGNFLVMPSTGQLALVAGKESDSERSGYRSEYSKETETASAGYYAVDLTRYHIKVETTASPHGGMLRFTFPENKASRIQIDLARRVGGTSTEQHVECMDKNTIRGWMKCTSEGGGWGNGDGHPDYTVYFYAQFSKALDDYGYWSADIPDGQIRKNDEVQSEKYRNLIVKSRIIRNENKLNGKNIGFFVEFPTKKEEKVTLKVGISFTGMDGAKKNFDKELKNKSFDQVHGEAREMWNTALKKIEIEGGTEDQKTIFYTSLYHTMIDPRNISDVDGRYPGPNGQIYQTSSFTKRTVFSGWDVFRSQFPLQAIINPKIVNDEINSLVSLAEQNSKGYLERWEFFNAYSGCMIGNPAISLIADAYAKGIRGYDIDKAYRAVIKTSKLYGNSEAGYTPAEKGYAVSETLEYAYSDWCVAELARMLGKTEDEKYYRKRSLFYKNIFDPEHKWFRPKKQDGTWEAWPEKGRLKEWYGCIESNPYQQGWFVPHDIEGMVELMGGREKTIADLENFFEKTPEDFLWNEYYNHANEPVHHIPFIFNRLNVPWLTQKWTRFICENAYKNRVEGLTGNEDAGQMSAWYVLAASGIHPVCPGETKYEITSPLFDKITFNLSNGKKFRIIARNNSPKNIYIQGTTLNGIPYHKSHIDYVELLAGGTLIIEMGAGKE